MKVTKFPLENKTRNLHACSEARQPTAPPCTPLTRYLLVKNGSAALSYSPPINKPNHQFLSGAAGSSEAFLCLSDHMRLIHEIGGASRT
jgi:hypothetical protein